MIKSVFAATAALSMSAGAALAGPYVNVEANAGWVGDDYTSTTTDIHVGNLHTKGEVGAASYYVQGGKTVHLRSWSLLTALTPKLSSLVKQVWVSPSAMR